MMKSQMKDVKAVLAVLLTVSGIAMCTTSLLLPPVGDIAVSVLSYFGECLVMSGSLLGIQAYINGRLGNHDGKED